MWSIKILKQVGLVIQSFDVYILFCSTHSTGFLASNSFTLCSKQLELDDVDNNL